MDTLTSAEFRLRYATLDQPTIVTAHGRPIGRWTPAVVPDEPEVGRPVQVGDYFRARGRASLTLWHQAAFTRSYGNQPIRYECRCGHLTPYEHYHKVVETQRERPPANLCRALR